MKLLLSCTRRWGEFVPASRNWGILTGWRYSVYRRIMDYYHDGSDAYDMRKPLKRDKHRKTVRANGENIKVDHDAVW